MLIYIGENEKFDLDEAVRAILFIGGVRNARAGEFIGAVFECGYEGMAGSTIVRISPEFEIITIEGLDDVALDFV
ncbi:hypothetical protein LL974_03320 [Xanthomonas campestris pv. cannae]|nr:hypothetical protein [Xanthomonas campestris pv. cannae]